MAYWRLFYHFVWTTKDRLPLLTPHVEQHVYRFLHAEARKEYSPRFVINGMPEPIHVLSAVRPAVAPSDFMHQLKGSSSRFISLEFKMPFEWQEGYGVFTVSEQDVPQVIRYIENQKQHHAQGTTIEAWGQTHHWSLGPAPREPVNGIHRLNARSRLSGWGRVPSA